MHDIVAPLLPSLRSGGVDTQALGPGATVNMGVERRRKESGGATRSGGERRGEES